MSARLDSLIGNSYSVLQFADLPVPSQLAIVWYLAVDCGAWDAVDLSLYSADHLESSLVDLLPKYVNEYGAELFGSVCLATSALASAIMKDEEIADSHSSWEDYHKWYLSCGDIPTHLATERWPVLLSSDAYETILDGWHRFHSYVRDGASEIQAVFNVSDHHLRGAE